MEEPEPVARFVVTVSPVPPGAAEPADGPTLEARVEVHDGRAHVVELTVRALPQGEVDLEQLLAVDMPALALAFDRSASGPHRSAVTSPVVRAADSTPAAGGAVTAPTAGVAVAEPPAPAAPARRAQRRSAAKASSGPPPRRAYRRMPAAAELQDVYTREGSIAGVAKHYDVPTYTAQGWIGRLRRLATDSA